MPLFLFMLLALSSSERVSVWKMPVAKPPGEPASAEGRPISVTRQTLPPVAPRSSKRASSVSGTMENVPFVAKARGTGMSAARAIQETRASSVSGTARNVLFGGIRKQNKAPKLKTAPNPQAQCCAQSRTSSVSPAAGSRRSAAKGKKCRCSSDPAGSGGGTEFPAGNGNSDVERPVGGNSSDSTGSGGGTELPAGNGNRPEVGSSSDSAGSGGRTDINATSEQVFLGATEFLGAGTSGYVVKWSVKDSTFVYKVYESEEERNAAAEAILHLPNNCSKYFAGLPEPCRTTDALEKGKCKETHNCVHKPAGLEWNNPTCYYLLMEYAGNKNIEECFAMSNVSAKQFVKAATKAIQCFHDHGFVHWDYQWSNLVADSCNPEVVKMVDLDCSFKPVESIGCEMYRDYAKLIGYENFDYGSKFGEFEIAKKLRKTHKAILTNESDVRVLGDAILAEIRV
eukprot:CAMPEP_0117487052 /NCGR_PEP_ID=MMETSP0784-20121206/15796_1 /TAXON_ID=39447 /ORGANISM="" /LENGTH=454 /DNA_ID=CAMNT_0005281687 /DNA_START=59 /DNA_END=1423 /DNA_ORIENTATION=-